MLNFLKLLLTPEFFFSIIRISAPILFATLAAIVVEKAGFCNIGLEGLMMFSALTGSLVSYYAHSWVWGLLAALAIGVLMSLMMGFFAFQLKTDITLVGIAINMMGSGGTLFLCKVITNLTEGTAMASSTGLINSNLLIPSINLPLISKIPFLGGILSGHNLLTWIAFLCCALTSVMLYKTSLGLNIRAVGENPNAASSVGVSVLKIKYIAIGFSGLMCGFGGAGAFSDGKFNFTTAFGGWLTDFMPAQEVMDLIGYVDSINVAHGATEELYSTDTPAARALEKKALEFDLHLLQAKVKHLGTEKNLVILQNIYEDLKQGIRLRAYGQTDPVVAYKREGFAMFDGMINAIREETVRRLYLFRLRTEEDIRRKQVAKITATGGAADKTVKQQPVKKIKIGANDPCPCGSGKKYKYCCRDKDEAKS